MRVASIYCDTSSTEPRWLITLLQPGAQLGRVNWKLTRDPNLNNLHVALQIERRLYSKQSFIAIDLAI